MAEYVPASTAHTATGTGTGQQDNTARISVEGSDVTRNGTPGQRNQSEDDQRPTVPPVQATVMIVSPKENDVSSGSFLKQLDAITALLKVMIWPVIVLLLLYQFYSPLSLILQALPSKVRDSSKISVGSLSFEIQQAAVAAGNPELAKLIGDLSPRAVEEMLKLQSNGIWIYVTANDTFDSLFIPTDAHKITLTELEKAGLIEFVLPRAEFDKFIEQLPLEAAGPDVMGSSMYRPTRSLTTEEKSKIRSQHYRLSAQGKKAYALILEGIKQSLYKPAEPAATP